VCGERVFVECVLGKMWWMFVCVGYDGGRSVQCVYDILVCNIVCVYI
jgi:hypothetical protein